MKESERNVHLHYNMSMIILGITFLLLGCLVYLLFRSETLNIYVWFKLLGLSGFVDVMRHTVIGWPIPSFIRYCLPDGLYCAAYILLIDAIWHDDERIIKYVILSIVPIVTIGSEVLQYYGMVRGTFDVLDLFCYMIPPLAYIVIMIINQSNYNYFKIKKIMKKYFYSVLVLALFAIGFAASDDSESSKVATEEAPTSMESVTVEKMLADLSENEMRAQKTYSDKWFEISGTLGNMDSEGEYFSLDGEVFRMISVHCKLPKEKREELTEKLINMNKGDHIAVKGKVTDMGEVMGYQVTIIDVYNK